MRNLYLATIFLSTVWLGACTTDSGVTIKCTIKGETKEFVTSPGREDCDKIRASGQTDTPGPVTTTTAPAKTEPDKKEPPIFANPVVSKTPISFVEPTNKKQRQDELVSKVTGIERDPFITIPGSEPAPAVSVPRPVIRSTNRPQISIKPVEPPSTAEASAVLVSGILDIADGKYAIVNAPGEPTSRPISLGQTFAGGKVLFKRVEDISGTTFVILEQNGVEVSRPVGKQTVAEAPKPK
ncbi:hypothetical protein Syn7502_00805 [Synechococcus sp. PCC 7502]|uniref:hypothetical protein n=1 Tax=Synechococcus sp. PCC 7502 TaxID=1173263 RepID=UPI00029FAAF6|nr:hypothetical protein [Synechococcus sp. PCC 7502]AFY72938.1 hypothetical protein Syn7502_00805 [Synechococcus sp. PCC 7502]